MFVPAAAAVAVNYYQHNKKKTDRSVLLYLFSDNDQPAVILLDGRKVWWVEGKRIK